MKTMKLIAVTMMLLVTPSAMAVTESAEGDSSGDEQCVNHGNQVQFSVSGNNSYKCQAQHCASGPSGAGSAGTAVATPAAKSDAGAQASAGTNCSQGNQTRAASTPLGGS